MRTAFKVIYWIFFGFVVMLSFALLVSYSTIHHHNWEYMQDYSHHWQICSSCLETTPRHVTLATTTKEATCIEEGIITYHCDECDFTKEEIRPTNDDHDFEETIEKEATCLDYGTKKNTCKICGEVEYETLGKLTEHAYTDGVCEVCGIPKTFGLQYTLKSDGTYSVAAIGFCTDTEIYIPKEHNGKPVTSINSRAFYDCDDIILVTIPESITTIGSDAFNGCSYLTDIYCKTTSKPSGWSYYWNYNCNATVHWGESDN